MDMMATPTMIKLAKYKTLKQQLEENPLRDGEFEGHLIDHKASLARRGIDFAKFVEEYEAEAKIHPEIRLGDSGIERVRKILGEKVEKRDFRKYFGILHKNHHARIDVDAEIAEHEEHERQLAAWREHNRKETERRRAERALQQVEPVAPRPNFLSEVATSITQQAVALKPRLDYSDYLQSDQWKLNGKLVKP